MFKLARARFWFYELEMVAWTPALILSKPSGLLALENEFQKQLEAFARAWISVGASFLPPVFMTPSMAQFGPRLTQQWGWPQNHRKIDLSDRWSRLHHRLLGEPVGVDLWQQMSWAQQQKNVQAAVWNVRKVLTLLPWRRLVLEQNEVVTSIPETWERYLKHYGKEPESNLLSNYIKEGADELSTTDLWGMLERRKSEFEEFYRKSGISDCQTGSFGV